jgi:hypothetical protein
MEGGVPLKREDMAPLRMALKSQYHGALAMLREVIERCPDELWFDETHRNAYWQVAYHAVFFTHLYLMPEEAAFRPWKGHQGQVQNPDGIAPDPPDPPGDLPVIPNPYAKADVLTYWKICDEMVDQTVDALDLNSPESGFSWYPRMPKLEHQIMNIRHTQHHTAQLADRLRFAANRGTRWVRGGR